MTSTTKTACALVEFYIRHWSPWLDIYILAKTIVALVNRDGAY